MSKRLNEKMIEKFKVYLISEEKSKSTVEKYVRDIKKFYEYLGDEKDIRKSVVTEYKVQLCTEYKITSINSMLVSVNMFLEFIGRCECKVKLFKIQKRMFHSTQTELTKSEYMRLLKEAQHKNNERLYMLLQTIYSTGVRVSEHKYITVDAIKNGVAIIQNKGKVREIYFSKKLRKMLLDYCKRNNICNGSIFITKKGKAMDRSNIWKMMKKLCESANVDKTKVFPHNLRHLFAFTYYHVEKNIVSLAGLLGHSSIETTRIYAMTNVNECEKTLSRLSLLPF